MSRQIEHVRYPADSPSLSVCTARRPSWFDTPLSASPLVAIAQTDMPQVLPTLALLEHQVLRLLIGQPIERPLRSDGVCMPQQLFPSVQLIVPDDRTWRHLLIGESQRPRLQGRRLRHDDASGHRPLANSCPGRPLVSTHLVVPGARTGPVRDFSLSGSRFAQGERLDEQRSPSSSASPRLGEICDLGNSHDHGARPQHLESFGLAPNSID